jgi:hypothetical protein
MYKTERTPLAQTQMSSESATLDLYDDFADQQRPGAVIGKFCKSGHQRRGTDVEKVLSIDNGALRIAPLIEAGFGRAVLSYGPFARKPGLAFAVHLLNGHNTSQAEPLSDTFFHRISLWIRGSETDPRWTRVAWWAWRARFRRALRQLRWWQRTARRPVDRLDENLAVGWFASSVERDPRLSGHSFMMRALGPENGELLAGNACDRTRSLRGVQNVPIYYIAVVRSEGTLYYVSSLEGASGLPAYPWMSPIAIDYTPIPDELYLGVQQSVLGQIGFRLDTRVYGARVGHLTDYEDWYGGAHAADRFGTKDANPARTAPIGGNWKTWRLNTVEVALSPPGTGATMVNVLDPGTPSGLVLVETAATHDFPARFGLVFRCLDEQNHWRVELRENRCELILMISGDRQLIVTRDLGEPNESRIRRLQVIDDGQCLMAYADGEPLLDTWIADERLSDATRVGLLTPDAEMSENMLGRFEAHPRRVRLPDIFDMGAPWFRKGIDVAIADDFTGAPGDLNGRSTSVGGRVWNRIIGEGIIDVTGATAARVRASVDAPCPGRTAYCVDWHHPEFIDVEVTITPPGTQMGDRQRTTAGLILYQDSRNYVTLNAYRSDYYPAGSVSTFFKFGGFEDVYDAIWSNVADRVNYGKPLRLRLCCDGERYLVFVNDETVLFRAFRDVYPDVDRLQIRKVGIIANWEFGTDTGSTFEHFKVRV